MNTQAGRVLVADADEGVRALCRHILEDLGFSIEIYEHGAQAAQMSGRTPVDAILIDPGGPGGAEIGQRVRADRRFAETVVLLVDSTALDRTAAPGAWPGVCGVLFKPLDADDVRCVAGELRARVLARRRNERLAKIDNLSTDLAMALDLDHVLHLTAEYLRGLPWVAQGYLFLGHGQPLRLDRRIAFGDPPPGVPVINDLNDPSGLIGQVFTNGVAQLRRVSGAEDGLAPWEHRLISGDGQALMCVALKAGNAVVGVIEVASRPNVPFSDEDFEALIMAAAPIALAVERARLHRQLVHDEKLASMGRMAASIAHEINNPLQAIHNSLHLLLSRSFSEEKRERYLTMAQMEVERLIAVVRQMLDFYRPSHEGMRPISIHGLLESVLAVTARQTQERRVLVDRDWADRLPRVRGNGGHLKHVFTSLISNAVTAMPDGGQLIVRTRIDGGQQGSASQVVLIEFVDSGPGISADEVRTIFDPQSAGLELVISYGIIEQHGGMLSVKSDSKGTTFRVALPVAGEG